MQESVFIRDADYSQVAGEIKQTLADIDQGGYDSDLAESGVSRPTGGKFSDGVTLSQGQGVSVGEYLQVLADFAPLIATVAEDVWTIVIVPRLKRKFHDDNVSENDPSDEQ